MEIPIITIEVNGMRETIKQALMNYNNEFNTLVSASVDKAFNIDAISAKIDGQVELALNNAINGISENYQIKEIVRNLVMASLTLKLEDINKIRNKSDGI